MSGEILARFLVSTLVVLISLAGWAFPAAAGSPSPDLLPVESGSMLLAEAPSNDDFNNAVVITLDVENKYSYSQNVLGATSASDDPVIVQTLGQAYSSVWYRFTPVQDGFFVLDTRFSNYDTIVSIWAGQRGSLKLLNYHDDVNVANKQSYLTVSVQAGVTYHIEINSKFEDLTSGSDLTYSGSFTPLLITAMNPPLVTAGSGGFTMIVTGQGFRSGAKVRWNGEDRPTTYVSATELQAQIPAADVASPGLAEVTVYHSGAKHAASTVPAEVTSPPVLFVIRDVPSNDDFDNAAAITGDSYSFAQDVLLATAAADDPILPDLGSQGYHSVWFRYTPAQDGVFTVETAGSSYDTVLSIWTGSRGALTLAGYQDDIDEGDSTSSVAIPVNAGTTYYIEAASKTQKTEGVAILQIKGDYDPLPFISEIKPPYVVKGGPLNFIMVKGTGFGPKSVVFWNGEARWTNYIERTNELEVRVNAADIAEAGTAQITVQHVVTSNSVTFEIREPAPNDDFDNALLASSLPFSHTVDPLLATRAADDPKLPAACSAYSLANVNHTVWYRFSPETNGKLALSTQTSNIDTVLAVWTGERGNLTNVGCHDDVNEDQLQFWSKIEMDVSAGTTYYIEVASVSKESNAGRSMGLDLTFAPYDNPVPVISSANPAGLLAGSGAFTMTVRGKGFVDGSVVQWNGAARPTDRLYQPHGAAGADPGG